jgi:hypothetical protein
MASSPARSPGQFLVVATQLRGAAEQALAEMPPETTANTCTASGFTGGPSHAGLRD